MRPATNVRSVTPAAACSLLVACRAAPYVTELTTNFRLASATAESLSARYESVPPLRSGRWTIAAYARQAEIYEQLVRALSVALDAQPSSLFPAAVAELRTRFASQMSRCGVSRSCRS